MAFGNGGTSVDTAGKVVYKSPRVSESFEASADLYSILIIKLYQPRLQIPALTKLKLLQVPRSQI